MSKQIAEYSAETTIAASGTFTWSPDYLHECDAHAITIVSGSGTAKAEGTPRVGGGGDASADVSIVTGMTSGYDETHLRSGLNTITITETGGANSVNVLIKSYRL